MPILVQYIQSGVSRQQYDTVKKATNWENDPPRGALFHVAAFDGDVIHVSDVWETRADMEDYVAKRLSSAAQKAGLTIDPPSVVETYMVAAYHDIDRYRLKAASPA
jgi:hypothetical protein